MDELRKRCFESLCNLCATRGVLPTSCTLNPSDLQHSQDVDYTEWFGKVWKGKFSETTVAIKKLQVSIVGSEQLKKVRRLSLSMAAR